MADLVGSASSSPSAKIGKAHLTYAQGASAEPIAAGTLRNAPLAWVLTLPVFVPLGATLFGASLFLLLRVFGIH